MSREVLIELIQEIESKHESELTEFDLVDLRWYAYHLELIELGIN